MVIGVRPDRRPSMWAARWWVRCRCVGPGGCWERFGCAFVCSSTRILTRRHTRHARGGHASGAASTAPYCVQVHGVSPLHGTLPSRTGEGPRGWGAHRVTNVVYTDRSDDTTRKSLPLRFKSRYHGTNLHCIASLPDSSVEYLCSCILWMSRYAANYICSYTFAGRSLQTAQAKARIHSENAKRANMPDLRGSEHSKQYCIVIGARRSCLNSTHSHAAH